MHGDPYGRLILDNKIDPEQRFCHIDHEHPEKPTVLKGDVNSE